MVGHMVGTSVMVTDQEDAFCPDVALTLQGTTLPDNVAKAL